MYTSVVHGGMIFFGVCIEEGDKSHDESHDRAGFVGRFITLQKLQLLLIDSSSSLPVASQTLHDSLSLSLSLSTHTH